ncbi:hypothetical protein Clacol_001684 [Clathrus columnatus]|uniref:RRM domain-containing protein n=1 Tax=Clathrus columnatus TaxID=1419009 RepID=A0AAV5A225_9AGAM|nr:hypothetical protein Clacol_001684 [Clathrus columnatus]
MSRGRSPSPRTLNNTNESDAEMRSVSPPLRNKEDSGSRVVVVSNLTRNVVEAHLRTIFTGQNRGKAALEFYDSSAAQKAASHMNKGYLDGAILNVQISDAILRDRSRSRSPRPPRNGRGVRRSPSRSLSPRRRPPPASRDKERDRGDVGSVAHIVLAQVHVLARLFEEEDAVPGVHLAMNEAVLITEIVDHEVEALTLWLLADPDPEAVHMILALVRLPILPQVEKVGLVQFDQARVETMMI